MRSKLLSGAAALALVAGTMVATASPAAAAWGGHRGWHGGWHGGWGGPGAIAAGVIGGAIAAATSPLWAPGYYDYYPGYAYGPGYGYAVAPAPIAPGGGSVAYCESRFRSYNPATGMYLGYDGQYHPCP
jgi:BA14K-like protein